MPANHIWFGPCASKRRCLPLPPQRQPSAGPKFDYKLRWFERMRRRADELWDSGQPVFLLGDWNVVPTDADIYKPDTWRDNALLQPEPREAFANVLAQGWTEALKTEALADSAAPIAPHRTSIVDSRVVPPQCRMLDTRATSFARVRSFAKQGANSQCTVQPVTAAPLAAGTLNGQWVALAVIVGLTGGQPYVSHNLACVRRYGRR